MKIDKQNFLIFSITAFLILLFDQIAKFFASKLTQSISVVKNIFHLTLVHNTGAGFGLFKDSTSLLIWFAIIVTGFILYMYDKIPKEKPVQISVALILGGIIGNLIDRIRLGYVLDFLDFRIWPAFNIADSAITIGTIILIIYLIKKK